MKWLRRCPRTHRASSAKHRSPAPIVEELEARRVLSAATQAVASGIVTSPENIINFVTSEYVNLLRRPPDSAGLSNWVNQMENGMSPESVEAGFVASNEYIQDFNNNPSDWVTAVYHDLLGRAPDSNGFNHWLNNMANGESAFGVATEIATGPEREAMVIRKDYTQFLGRIARNDEVDSWLAVFQQGSNRANVATGIVASDEFFADANKDPSTFITHAYQDVLSRTPNSNEVAFWLNVYNNP